MSLNCLSQKWGPLQIRSEVSTPSTHSRFGGVPFRRLQNELKDNDLAPLRDAKIMIVEENESFAGTSGYIEALREFLARPN